MDQTKEAMIITAQQLAQRMGQLLPEAADDGDFKQHMEKAASHGIQTLVEIACEPEKFPTAYPIFAKLKRDYPQLGHEPPEVWGKIFAAAEHDRNTSMKTDSLTSRRTQSPELPHGLIFGWCIAAVALTAIVFLYAGFLPNTTAVNQSTVLRTLGISLAAALVVVIFNGGIGRTRKMLREFPGSGRVFLAVYVIFGIPIVYGCMKVADAVLASLH